MKPKYTLTQLVHGDEAELREAGQDHLLHQAGQAAGLLLQGLHRQSDSLQARG